MHRGQPAEVNVVSEGERHMGIDRGAGRQTKKRIEDTLYSLNGSWLYDGLASFHDVPHMLQVDP